MRKPGNPTGKNERKILPPAEVLRERFFYDAGTGVLHDLAGSKMRARGAAVGFVEQGSGYLRTDMPEGRFFVHRIIWKLVTGAEPPRVIDHKDTDRTNNRFKNLREADDHLNGGNQRPHSDAASPLKGVFRHSSGSWTSQICVRRKRYHLGYFNTPEEAHAAYCAAAKKHFGEFARAA